jgi:hypothetical protein
MSTDENQIKIVRPIFQKEYTTLTEDSGTILYKLEDINNFLYNKQLSKYLNSCPTIEKNEELYVTETSFIQLLHHDGRRYLEEIKDHIDTGLSEVDDIKVNIGNKDMIISCLSDGKIQYSKETKFVFQTAQVLKSIFNYKDEDMEQYAPFPLDIIHRRTALLLPKIRICIEFDKDPFKDVNEKKMDAILLTKKLKVIRYEGESLEEFYNKLHDFIIKRIKSLKNEGITTIERRKEILYEEFVTHKNNHVAKMMIPYIFMKQEKPFIPFDEARKMIKSDMSMGSFEEEIKRSPKLCVQKYVDFDKRLMSLLKFYRIALNINQSAYDLYQDIQDFDRQHIRDLYETQCRDTAELNKAGVIAIAYAHQLVAERDGKRKRALKNEIKQQHQEKRRLLQQINMLKKEGRQLKKEGRQLKKKNKTPKTLFA